MSINLSLVPLALVMYMVMGEERFNEFVRQNEDVKYTKFKSIKSMEKYVKLAGYDFGEQYGILKTHFKNQDYFIWEIRDGQVCAVFSIYDEKSEVINFIKAVERVVGLRCFYNSVSDIANPSAASISAQFSETKKITQKPVTEQVFQTKFADKELLIKTLESLGLKCTENNGEITCSSDNYTLIFTNKNNSYEFKIRGSVTNKQAYQKYKDIDTKYGKIVQKEVVENVKKKVAKSPSMQLENEELLEDNSVLLTIRV